jgi:hypothetical protein
MQIRSEIKFTLDFVKTNLITKQTLNKFTHSNRLITDESEINYISVVLSLHSAQVDYYYTLCKERAVNTTLEALVYAYTDLYLKPILEEASAPLRELTLKLLKEPSKASDYIKSAYNTLPTCYKGKGNK